MIKKDKTYLLSLCARHVQKYDPDRFYCSLFIPVFCRELVLQLLAFNIEITRAVSVPSSWSVAGPMAGLIRLQWWRELLEGKDRTHEIAPFILESIQQKLISEKILLQMIEAKEEELDGIQDWDHWDSVLRRSSGKMQEVIACIMGVDDKEHLQAISSLGVAYEISRIAKNLPVILYSGRCPLPKEIIDQYYLERTDDGIKVLPETIQHIRKILVEKTHEYLKEGSVVRKLGRKKNIALLPIILAKRDLKRHKKWDKLTHKRGVGDQLSVYWGYFRGKIPV